MGKDIYSFTPLRFFFFYLSFPLPPPLNQGQKRGKEDALPPFFLLPFPTQGKKGLKDRVFFLELIFSFSLPTQKGIDVEGDSSSPLFFPLPVG